ncbi:unnamed protein product [Ostreobium quekettii]|uniref:Alpha-type protein kinase domain-containing protein n=1 Tax=Ostreobium quekettii TaxID=121088 RepID=A0A8S1ISB9_9CHLO|nr:unnamed protein product [Ostreobium quekettii]
MSLQKCEMTRKRQMVIDAMFVKAQQCDLCFVVDCTGSMAAYIREVKNKVKEMVDDITSRFRYLKVRIAFVGYRDFCDGDDRLDVFNFNRDVKKFTDFVEGRKPFGGGDFPEDVFGGLNAAINLNWESETRILIHIADAPCHGDKFLPKGASGDDERHKLDARGRDRSGLSAPRLLSDLRDRALTYHFFHVIANNTIKMVSEFKKIASPMGFKISEVDLKGTPNLLQDAVVNSVTASIAGTLHLMSKKARARRARKGRKVASLSGSKVVMHGKQPNWDEISEEQALEVWCEPPTELEDLCEGLDLVKRQHAVTLKVASKPFAEGHQRRAYYAQDVSDSKMFELVMKRFKNDAKSPSDYSKYEDQMEIQCVAGHLATLFNAKLSSLGFTQKVEFLRVRAIKMISRQEPFHANLEPLLKGEFEKFNSNCGYVGGLHDVLQAFSHWTYRATNGFLMVVDLQGLKASEGYMLTDPAIHCKELCTMDGRYLFGTTNLGQKGMEAFFATHRCSDVCKGLNLSITKGHGEVLRDASLQ